MTEIKREEYKWECRLCRKDITPGRKMVLAFPKNKNWDADQFCEPCFDRNKKRYEKIKYNLKKYYRRIDIYTRPIQC